MATPRPLGSAGIVRRGGNFRFSWRGAVVTNGLDQAVQDACQDTADAMKEHAQAIVHVITGRLRDSITGTADIRSGRRVAVLEAAAPYALMEELGTRTRAGHPYLRPAIDAEAPRFTERLRAATRRRLGA